MKLQLIGDRLLCRIHENSQSAGGIILPEIARDNRDFRVATVTHAGEKSEPKAGDKVILDFGGNWTRIDGELLAVVQENNVLAILGA